VSGNRKGIADETANKMMMMGRWEDMERR